MSSRFVSAGGQEPKQQPSDSVTNDAWAKAQQQIEAARNRKPAVQGEQEGGKSLYEVLQANKAAKQDAFEEATKLRNQFRALDEDEIDFLDSVTASERSKEAAVRHETAEQLEDFRKQRAAAEQAALEQAQNRKLDDSSNPPGSAGAWTSTRKRRRSDLPGENSQSVLKFRRNSSTKEKQENNKPPEVSASKGAERSSPSPQKVASLRDPQPAPVGLGLDSYASDSDD